MAQMYFAKFNINSEIFDVYDDDGLKETILDSVFNKMNDKYQYIEKSGTDKETRYKFCTLEKNIEKFFIAGRLVKIFKGDFSTYNKEKDDIDTYYYDNSASGITFYFDLKREEIAFTARNNFGRKEFAEKFTLLVEGCVEEYEFEVVLETNIDKLKERIKEFAHVSQVTAIIIPPNNDKKAFKRLYGATAKDIKEANATKYTQVLNAPATKNSSGINTESDFMERMLYGVELGYATLSVTGKNENNPKYTITSDEHAPLTRPIPNNSKDSIGAVIDYGQGYINQIILRKMERNK